MKAMLLPVIGAEAPASAGDESAASEKGAQGFDAVLAAVSAQAANQAPAPKTAVSAQAANQAPAPKAGQVVRSEGNAMPAQTGSAHEPQAVVAAAGAGRAPSAGFGPWLVADAVSAELVPQQAQVAAEAATTLSLESSADEGSEPELASEAEEDAQLAAPPDARAALPANLLGAQAPVAAPRAPAPVAQPAAQVPAAVNDAPAPRASAALRTAAQAAPPAQEAAAQAQVAHLFQQELLAQQPVDMPRSAAQLQPDAAAQLSTSRPAAQVAGPVVKAAAAPAGVPVRAERVDVPVELLAAPRGQAAQPHVLRTTAVQAPASAELAPEAAAPSPETLLSADPRVTVRMLAAGQSEQVAQMPELDGAAPLAAQPEHDAAAQPELAGEGQQLEAQAAQAAPRAQQPAPLQNAEVQGARGLEAVVASLLRAGNRDASIEQPGRRVSASRTTPQITLETDAAVAAASARVKLAEGAGDAQDALARQRDEREPAAREQLELPLPHAVMQPELAPRKDAPVELPAAPLPLAPQTPDPDALQAGKPGQNGASITIDHPELGAMDLLVQSQNGRIEVRAILETPHAAQVLRAQESALRYGIQQAGMTFGALKVRTRSADGETVKARDNLKQLRRRDHEWEA